MFSDSGERILTPTDRLRALKSELASSRALYAGDHPDITRLAREIAGLEEQGAATADDNDLLRQLDAARSELGAAREKYSPEHPDVKNAERTVAALEAELGKPRSTAKPRQIEAPDNPAYIQIQAQLSSITNDQRALASKIASLRAQADGYQKNVAMSPVVEREYRELSRDYENARSRYQEVRAKQNEAELAQNLETNRKGERFTLIEPPLSPEEPVSPNRLAVFIIGLILSLGLAAAVAALREAMDTSVRGRRDVELLGSSAPLALIPIIVTAADVARGKKLLRFAAGGAMASAVVALRGRSSLFSAARYLVVHRHAAPRDLTGVHRGSLGLVFRAAAAPRSHRGFGTDLRARPREPAPTARDLPRRAQSRGRCLSHVAHAAAAARASARRAGHRHREPGRW